jgi:hypothetical protein
VTGEEDKLGLPTTVIGWIDTDFVTVLCLDRQTEILFGKQLVKYISSEIVIQYQNQPQKSKPLL